MIKNAIIMALDKRKDLWRELEQLCIQKGFNVKPFISGDGSDNSLKYDYIDPNPVDIPNSYVWGGGKQRLHHYLGYLTHKKILEYVMKNNWEGHLLLEDDAYIVSNRWDKSWNYISEEINKLNEDYDLIYLGYHVFEYENNLFSGRNIVMEERYEKNGEFKLVPIKFNCSGMHGVIVNKRHYKKMYSYPPRVPIDSQWNNDQSLIRYMVQPRIIALHSCWSSCEQSFVQRNYII